MRRTRFVLTLTLLFLGLLVVSSSQALAQGPADKDAAANGCLPSGQARIARNPRTQRLTFVGAEPGIPIPRPNGLPMTSSGEKVARAYFAQCGDLFGLRDEAVELQLTRERGADKGRSMVRFQQVYKGVPVLAGETIVQVDQSRNVEAVVSKVLPDIAVDLTPTVETMAAAAAARASVAKNYRLNADALAVTAPELTIYNPGMLEPGTGRTVLAWRMEVTPRDLSPVKELVLVDAQQGNVVLAFNQIEDNKDRTTYTANNGSVLPGAPVCNEANPSCAGGDTDAQSAHLYAGDTYDFYMSKFGRDSINGAGLPLISTVHYSTNYFNAFWNGVQMVYGDAAGFARADDVVGHELSHGVTQYESGLFYYYQAGAINESLSDIFGEFVDQTNGHGTDTPAVKWLMGEDVTGLGAIRNMQDPPNPPNKCGTPPTSGCNPAQPDKMTSTSYYTGAADNGGVHYNSGIGNKAAYLLTDGGTFNSQTVAALGLDKTARIFYEVQTNLLLSGSDYGDLYNTLYQACVNLVGKNGITLADCAEVRKATDAVEMNLQPVTGFNLDAPICPTGQQPNHVFFDNLETGAYNWGVVTATGTARWYYGSPYGAYAHSGQYFLYANDYPATVTDSAVGMTSDVTVPSGAFLHFAHAFGFESGSWDGGVVEYSTNGGSTWTDAAPLFDGGGYNGTIGSGFSNPLSGKAGYVNDSHGYISSRLNLNSLAGQNVRFRWRLGLDSSGYNWGWWLDDVRVYTCASASLPALSINSVTLNEGNSGTTNAVFTVSLTPASSNTVTVNYATSNLSAAAGSDYTATSGVLTFNPGQTSQTINVPVLGDTTLEYDETFFLRLSAPSNAALANVQGVGTILTDDVGAPTVTTNAATSITTSGATLNGSVNANNAATIVTFQWGSTAGGPYPNSVNASPSGFSTSTNTSVTAALSSLTPNTTYYYRVVAFNSVGLVNGAETSFTTSKTGPTVLLNPPTGITHNAASVSGIVTANNDATTVMFQWRLASGSQWNTVGATPATATGMAPTPVTATLTGLTPNTGYFVRLYVTTTAYYAYTAERSFTTQAAPPPPPAASDLNGDHKSDLVWRNSGTGEDVAWLMNGTSFSSNPSLPTLEVAWKVAGMGDLNGDGKVDLVWRNSATGDNKAWLMNGGSVSSDLALLPIPDLNFKLVGVGDLNGDGKADLIWRHFGTGVNVVWFMNGATMVDWAYLPTVADLNLKVVAVDDLNGDGKVDLVWRHFATGQNVVWLMNGATMVDWAYLPTLADLNLKVVGSGDFNSDGKADLIWRHFVTGQNIVWYMNGTALVDWAYLPALPDFNFTVVSVGDFNGDGKADLIWRHFGTGQNVVWLLNGAALADWAFLPTYDLNWRAVSATSILQALNGLLPGPTKREEAEGPASRKLPVDAAPFWSAPPTDATPLWQSAPKDAQPMWSEAPKDARPMWPTPESGGSH